MLNPISAIHKLYRISAGAPNNGIDTHELEAQERALNIQLPALLYHYYHDLGRVRVFDQGCTALAVFPFEQLGDYLVIAKSLEADAVWGIDNDFLKLHDPIVSVSRNFDAVDPAQVHWFEEQPLSAFLLAQAIYNGVNGALAHYATIYDFDGTLIPADIFHKLDELASEIPELRQRHERYYQAHDYGVVMLVSLGEDSQPTAFLLGSQDSEPFDNFINQLALQWDYRSS